MFKQRKNVLFTKFFVSISFSFNTRHSFFTCGNRTRQVLIICQVLSGKLTCRKRLLSVSLFSPSGLRSLCPEALWRILFNYKMPGWESELSWRGIPSGLLSASFKFHKARNCFHDFQTYAWLLSVLFADIYAGSICKTLSCDSQYIHSRRRTPVLH